MLALYTAAGSVPIQADDYYIRQIYSGYDEAVFSISIWDENYRQMEEESVIIDTETGITYLIKAIDAGGDTAKIKAQIDLDDWRGSMTVPYNSGSHTVGYILSAIKPTGWSVVDESSMAYIRTIGLDSATPLDVLEACRDTFPGITFRFDNGAKTVTIKNPTLNSVSNGSFASRQLNLKENNYKGKSNDLYNRLYAYGKDGLSIASVNPTGQPYVDCNPTYSSRVICAYWKDERYTDAASLLADAQAKVNAAGIPTRSFDCNVVDLAAVDPEKYSYLSFPLFSTITLIDDTRGAGGVLHQVTERWHYPLRPELDKVVLSTAPQRISSQVQQIRNDINNRNSAWYQNFVASISDASEWITNTNGHVYFVRDGNGLPTEILIVNDQDNNKVWRWSAGGLGYSSHGVNGPFTLAITAGGEIVADFITTGELNAAIIKVGTLFGIEVKTEAIEAVISANEKLYRGVDIDSGKVSFYWEKRKNDGTVIESGTFGDIAAVADNDAIALNIITNGATNDIFVSSGADVEIDAGTAAPNGTVFLGKNSGKTEIAGSSVKIKTPNQGYGTYGQQLMSGGENGSVFWGNQYFPALGVVVVGQPSGDSSYATAFIPKVLWGSGMRFEIGSGSSYTSFYVDAQGNPSTYGGGNLYGYYIVYATGPD